MNRSFDRSWRNIQLLLEVHLFLENAYATTKVCYLVVSAFFSHFNKKLLSYIIESTQSGEGDTIYLSIFLGKMFIRLCLVEFPGSSWTFKVSSDYMILVTLFLPSHSQKVNVWRCFWCYLFKLASELLKNLFIRTQIRDYENRALFLFFTVKHFIKCLWYCKLSSQSLA